MGHAQARGIAALSLERNSTRRGAAKAVAKSQRPELHGTPVAFLVEADTSPRNKQIANNSTRGPPLLPPKGMGVKGKLHKRLYRAGIHTGVKIKTGTASPTRNALLQVANSVLQSVDLNRPVRAD